MAYTKRHPIKSTLEKSLKYINNDKKTQNGLLVYGLNCSINTKVATKQMEHTKKFFGKEDKNLAYHFIQSFKDGEIKDYNIAHKIGIEWAKKISNDKYQVMIATHTDEDHIHNHVIINSVSFQDGKKYNSCKDELRRIREISDKLCKEYNLSIIEPKGKGKQYKEWLENKKGTSWKANIKIDIDNTINKVKTFEEFIRELEEKGYTIKHGNVKHIVFKMPGQQRATRGRTIGEEYTEEAIKRRIEEKLYNIENFSSKNKKTFINKKDVYKYKYRKASLSNNIKLTILLINTLLKNDKAVNTSKRTYVKKYSDIALRKLENTLMFISKENINTISEVKDKITDINNKINKIDELIIKLESVDSKMTTIKDNIESYNKYKSIYNEYESLNKIFKIPYAQKHKEELNIFMNTKEILQKFNIKDEDTMNDLLIKHKDNRLKIDDYKNKRDIIVNKKEEVEEIFKTIDKVYKNEYIETIKKATNNNREEKSKENIR